MIAVHPFALPSLHRRRNAFIAVVLLACSSIFSTPGRGAPPARPTAVEVEEQMRQSLPTGWTVQTTSIAALPAGWQSTDATAVVLKVGDGRQSHTVTVVPLDWVGAQPKGAPIDLVRRGATAKVIVSAGTSGDRLSWLDTFAPAQASLATADGSTNAYAGQYARVESEIRTLTRKGGVSREQAVASLIALGVPAEDLIRDAALDPRSPARLAAIQSLRHFPGKATREALVKIITDRSKEATADKCRFAALDTCEALLIDTHGPAVVTALQVEKDEATAVRLALEINRLRYAPASAELRRWLKASQSIESKVAFARALATIRDTAAAPDIRAALTAPAPRRAAVTPAVDASARRDLEIELLRLTGTWGPEVRGTRLAVVMESPDRVTAYVENLGAGPLRFIPYLTAAGTPWPVGLEITLDGAVISPPGPGAADIGRAGDVAREVTVGTTVGFELQLTGPVSPQGEHTLTATWFDLSANVVAVRSGAVVATQP